MSLDSEGQITGYISKSPATERRYAMVSMASAQTALGLPVTGSHNRLMGDGERGVLGNELCTVCKCGAL
jgi:hypothetical protein